MIIQLSDVYNIVILKSIEANNNSKCMIGYLDDVVIPLVLKLPKTSGQVKTSKGKKNKSMSFCINDDKL